MSHRLQIVIPDSVATQLAELAAAEGEPVAALAARMVRHGVERTANGGKVEPSPPPPSTAATMDRRPPWLEPYGGDQRWREETWGAIVALHGRYPRHLEHLKDGWWTDAAHTETLCALAVWRAEIDDAGRDPREELAFHHQLANFAHTLRHEAGGFERAWVPGAPPEQWHE